jgi:hypothetical protein
MCSTLGIALLEHVQVTLGAFRTYPANYTPPSAGPSQCELMCGSNAVVLIVVCNRSKHTTRKGDIFHQCARVRDSARSSD